MNETVRELVYVGLLIMAIINSMRKDEHQAVMCLLWALLVRG